MSKKVYEIKKEPPTMGVQIRFQILFACYKLLGVGQLFYFLAEFPPFGKAVIFALAVHGFKAAVVGGEAGGKLKAAGVGIEKL